MASIVETSKCEADELVLLLTHCLPPDLATLWHTTEDILVMLRDGGISSYTNKKRIATLLRNQKRIILEPNRLNKVNWYCFNEKEEFDDPRQQKIALKEKERPQIEPNYFTNLGITFKYIKTQTTANTTTSTTATNTNAERIRRLRENNEGYRETERRANALANALATAERMGNFTQFITYTCNEYQHNRPEHIHLGIGVNEESQ